ncbi:hypothetical protein MIMGU_mgv1a0220071mg, partial [Erythranthe guttata]
NEGSEFGGGGVYLYGLIEKKQVVELSSLGDDLKRIEMLTRVFGVRLVGRNGLCDAAESLIGRMKSGKSVPNLV